MTNDKSVTEEICEFLDTCPLDGFIEKMNNSEISVNDTFHIEETIAKVKLSESKLRKIRQQIEHQMRRHRLQEFKERA